MGIETALLVASLVTTMAAAAAQADAAQSAAKADAEAAEQMFVLQEAEFLRQQGETNRLAKEEKGDVVREAEREIGTLYANVGELGVSGSSIAALAAEIGGYEGLDLSRIENNRKAQNEMLQASKRAAAQGTTSTINASYRQGQAKATGAIIRGVGTSLQIGASYYGRTRATDAARKASASRTTRARN